MQSALAYIYSLYGALLVPFGTADFGPKLATGLLFLALLVFLAFLCFALPQAFRLRSALVAIKGDSDRESEQQKRATFQSNYDGIDTALLSNKATSIVWQEFRKTLIFRGSAQRAIILASTRPSNFFNTRNLLVQYDFVRSLPNFFVGLGLLGTFIGLIAALTFATQDLTTAADQEHIKGALNRLLTTAAAKFYISAAGLVASLILSLLIRLTLKHLHGRVHQINDALEERLLFVSEQTITEKQLSIQQESLEELRLFNTNIAMKIGDAVRSAVEASNDTLTNKLSEIAGSFAKLVDASGEGAGKAVGDAMKGAFDASLRQAGQAIESIATELRELPAHFNAAAASIQNAGSAAAKQQEQLAAEVREALKAILNDAGSQISSNIDQGTRNLLEGLNNSGSAFGESAAKIGAFFERFSDSGEDYMKSLTSLSSQNEKLEISLGAISSQIAGAADSVTRASSAVDSNLDRFLSGIDDVTRVSAETSRIVRESQETVRGAIETLQQQMSLHLQRFNTVDEKLASVFTSIGSHLELQSKQMGEQLTTMDQALARAVNQFEQLIDDLTEAMSRRQAAE
jgi:DNA anti-recombination protein RmuC